MSTSFAQKNERIDSELKERGDAAQSGTVDKVAALHQGWETCESFLGAVAKSEQAPQNTSVHEDVPYEAAREAALLARYEERGLL